MSDKEFLISRRSALKGMTAGIAGVSIGVSASVSSPGLVARDPDTTRSDLKRPVVINGKRMLTIDIHAHCQVDAIWPLVKDVLADEFEGENPFRRGPLYEMSDIPARLREMDAMGIDVQVLSLNTTQILTWAGRELAEESVAIQNQALTDMVKSYPDRFVAVGTVALQFPELAAAQLEHAVKKLGHKGVMIRASVNGEELSHPKFHPFWAKAEELGVMVFIHPDGFSEGEERFKGNGRLTNIIGYPLETTVALSHLIFEGTLDRFPGLKILASHGGGFLPSYIGRSDHCHNSNDRGCRGAEQKLPSEYIKQIYCDTLVYRTANLEHLIREVGPGQVVMGSDFPFGMVNKNAVAHVLSAQGLTDAEIAAILGGTAARLLNIDAAEYLRRNTARG